MLHRTYMQQSSLLVFQDHQAQLAASLLNERFSANLARQIVLNHAFKLLIALAAH